MYNHKPSHLDERPYPLMASHAAQLCVYSPICHHNDEHDRDNRHNVTDNPASQIRTTPSSAIISPSAMLRKMKVNHIRFLLGMYWVSNRGRLPSNPRRICLILFSVSTAKVATEWYLQTYYGISSTDATINILATDFFSNFSTPCI